MAIKKYSDQLDDILDVNQEVEWVTEGYGGDQGPTEVAEEILKILNLTDEIKVNKVKSDYFKKTFFAERPDSENLINKKLNQKGLNLMRPWQETLREYINTSYIKYL